MRDAFGGAFMIKLGLVFLAIYIAFMALALSYAKAFRVKNQIINYIEQCEGFGRCSYDSKGQSSTTQELIDNYLKNANYYVNVASLSSACLGDNTKTCGAQGYLVEKKGTTDKTYYMVTTYMAINFPFFNIHFTVPIKGETRIVTNAR